MSDATSPHGSFGAPQTPPPGDGGGIGGASGLFRDASTLAATGLLGAVGLAIVAGVINAIPEPALGGFRSRLLALTTTVDVGDVALIGLAVALLLVTPDPPGGISRATLLRVAAGMGAVIAFYGVVRAFVVISESGGDALGNVAGFLATIGVAMAAATVAYYAARESFLKPKGLI